MRCGLYVSFLDLCFSFYIYSWALVALYRVISFPSMSTDLASHFTLHEFSFIRFTHFLSLLLLTPVVGRIISFFIRVLLDSNFLV